jgi:hypothetical protein
MQAREGRRVSAAAGYNGRRGSGRVVSLAGGEDLIEAAKMMGIEGKYTGRGIRGSYLS